MKLSDEAIRMLNTSGIPDYMHQGIIDYYNEGIELGDFLSAVINNDLKGAFRYADSTNIAHVIDYLRWFYWYAPSQTWGYPGAVATYLEEFWAQKALAESSA